MVAINQQGGQAERKINVAYLPPPIKIVIEGISLRKPNSTAAANPRYRPADWRPDIQAESESFGHPGSVQFDNAFDSSHLWVYARIDWQPDASQTPPLEDLVPVQVWVNGFQQASSVVNRPDNSSSNFQRFHLPVTLNQARNKIHLKAVGLPTSIDGEPVFEVDCSNPSTEQWMHLLVMGIYQSNSEIDDLEEQALRAFRAKRVENSLSQFTTNAFTSGMLYRTPDYVSYPQFNDALQEIRHVIRENTRRIPNHVLAIYYQGGQILRHNDKTYLTLKPPGETPLATLEHNAIDLDALEEEFSKIWGAHLLFLDASQAENQRFLLAKDSETALFPQLPGRFGNLLTAVDKAFEPEFVDHDGLKQNLMSQLLGSQPNIDYEPIVPDAMAGLILKK